MLAVSCMCCERHAKLAIFGSQVGCMARKLIAIFSMFILGPSKPDAVVQGILCHSYYQSVGKLTELDSFQPKIF